MKLIELTVPTLQGSETLTAIQVTEHFAIHDTVGARFSISITHMPSLRRMAMVEGLALAVAASEAWQSIGIDWSFAEPEGIAAMSEDHRAQARLIRDFAEDGFLGALRNFKPGASG